MTELTKLKIDRDICYAYACTAYGQQYINALLFEGDEPTEDFAKTMATIREIVKPIPHNESEKT